MSVRFDSKLGSAYRRSAMGYRRWGVMILSVLLSYGSALAQDEDDADDADDQVPTPTLTIPDDTLNEASSLSHDEKKARAEKLITDMREALKRATEILAEARA